VFHRSEEDSGKSIAVSQVTISEAPLIGLFGSKAAYQVLMFLENYGQGYATEIARTFGMSLSQVQNQLRKFEELGLLVSRREGSARFYFFARSPVSDSLRKFLRSALDSLPEATLQKFYRARRRPRRYGKR
jgi:DNA-binding transcriptional ArsR family regulator